MTACMLRESACPEFALDGRAVGVAVTFAAPWIAVDDYVTGRGQHLELVEECLAILAVRSAMDSSSTVGYFAPGLNPSGLITQTCTFVPSAD